MKKVAVIVALLIYGALPVWAQPQSSSRSMQDSARLYFEKKDFLKAFSFYEAYYSDPNNPESNYDTFDAAVAACHAGQMQKAIHYLQRSAEIAYDLVRYDLFANNQDARCLHQLPEWKHYITEYKRKADSFALAIKKITDILYDSTTRVNKSLFTDTNYWNNLAGKNTPLQLMKLISSFNNYPTPGATGHWTVYHMRVRDSLEVPFLFYIPKNYQPTRKTPLYIYLHGAVRGRSQFPPPALIVEYEEKVLKKAIEQNAFIIFPFARRDFNWLFHQDAFELILSEISLAKSLYHIDDDRVYIGGHSNGGSGAFWFALHKATPFAAYYALCQDPVSYTGNTLLVNLRNKQRFLGLSTTDDYAFKIDYVNAIAKYAKEQGANWTNFTVAGNHNLPYTTPDSMSFLFDTIRLLSRDPAPRQINWETQDIKNGQYFWVGITALDTLANKADWHQVLNPSAPANDGTIRQLEFNKRRTGAIKAAVKDNKVYVDISRVGAFDLYILPALFDLNKPVQVYVNKEFFFSGKVIPDKDFLLKTFLKTKDKTFLPVAKISWLKEPKK